MVNIIHKIGYFTQEQTKNIVSDIIPAVRLAEHQTIHENTYKGTDSQRLVSVVDAPVDRPCEHQTHQ
jgi:hypothetical protein